MDMFVELRLCSFGCVVYGVMVLMIWELFKSIWFELMFVCLLFHITLL